MSQSVYFDPWICVFLSNFQALSISKGPACLCLLGSSDTAPRFLLPSEQSLTPSLRLLSQECARAHDLSPSRPAIHIVGPVVSLLERSRGVLIGAKDAPSRPNVVTHAPEAIGCNPESPNTSLAAFNSLQPSSDLSIVTMTVKTMLSQPVDLSALALFLPGGNIVYDPKSIAVEDKKSFANQAEVKIRLSDNRVVSISVFRNGQMKLAGVKSFEEGSAAFAQFASRVRRSFRYLPKTAHVAKFAFVSDHGGEIVRVSAVKSPKDLSLVGGVELVLCNRFI